MTVTLLDQDGQPMRRAKGSTAFQAADPIAQDLIGWHPVLASPDAEYLPERDTIVARIRDLVRNNGWAAGGLQRELDNVIGGDLRLSCKPDWRALGLDETWAHEYAAYIEARWRQFANDPRCYCDAERHQKIGGLFGLAYRHYVGDGDALAVMLWRPDRDWHWATTVKILDPDRLSNPNDRMDDDRHRGGVEIDEDGAALAYNFRRRHQNDVPMSLAQSFTWDRLPRETAWGRPLVVHHFDKLRAGMTRGAARLTPVLEKLKMLDKYDKVELQAATLNALLAAFIESPMDHALLADLIDDGQATGINAYQAGRSEFHEKRRITLGGVRIPTLFPGEKIGFQTATRPNAAFEGFEAVALRNIAAAHGLSYEQLSQDWSKTNYSSARAALLEVWKTFTVRRSAFASGFCTPIYLAWLEEEFDRGEVPLPRSAPDFHDGLAAYAQCKWIGPGRGWVDPVKEKQGAILGMASGLSTLEDENAEQGRDYQETLDQIRREIAEMPDGVLHPAQSEYLKLLAKPVLDTREEQGK